MTPDDAAEFQAATAFWEAGHEAGRKDGEAENRALSERVDKLETKLKRAKESIRIAELDMGRPGAQLVTIDGRWAYQWEGSEPLKVGDKVWLPGAWYSPSDWIGEVTELGSTYKGEHRRILRRA